jgi:hypothetical protein
MSWSLAVNVAVQTAVLGQIDANGAAAYLEIRDSSNVLLSTLPFTYPAGTVSPGTGRLTLVFGDRDEAAAATGTADYAILKSANGTVINSDIPCQEGTAPVSGYCVLPSLSIVVDTPVEGTSFTIG